MDIAYFFLGLGFFALSGGMMRAFGSLGEV